MSEPTRLPNWRRSISFNFEAGGMKFVCTFSRFADGRVGEVFLTNHRVNSQAGIWASDQAVLTSLCLQHGCSLETLGKALMRDGAGCPTSPIGAAIDRIIADDGAAP